ncbi:MAG: hypothetical protein JSS62_04605 [Verrucomicrobia bacterium]|nr:hypothetical protein [Verrucomicrobiota bacterium]MBS0645723.1 hypothetical protein [Verrucomicrobiota bacterium]
MLNYCFGLLAAVGLSATGLANEDAAVPSWVNSMEKPCFEPFTGKITGNKVRMRTQPSLEGHVIKELRNGEMFAIVAERDGFYAVTPPQDTKGYVFRTFVLDGVVEADHVNIRLYPDIDAPVIGQLNTGDRIHTKVSDVNNKWLELDLPSSANFYVAQEFVDKIGPVEMLAQIQARHRQATHQLNAACLYAQSEIQKSLPQVDLDSIHSRFTQVSTTYKDLPEIADSAEEADRLISEVYLQKKLSFLENKSDHLASHVELNPTHVEGLAKLGIHIKPMQKETCESSAESRVTVMATIGDQSITDKMLIWEPLERSLHQLWAATHGNRSIDEFYQDGVDSAVTLTGIVEPYNRPVKNLPGDYLLRIDNHPVAFLYSTKVNLQGLVGKQITVTGAPRPNNHFAFPAYFVLSVE